MSGSKTPSTDVATFDVYDGRGNLVEREVVKASFCGLLESRLYAALARIPTWTPTTDLAALPPFDTYVIVHSRSGITSMMHRSRHGRGGWAWREHFKTWAQSEITHWMPKPEAPEAPSKEVAK